MSEVEDFLAHYGVKGMRWGVRKGDYEGASRSTNKEARKDAEEFARAKMFYGQGAGTRRKLIRATVDAKSKKDPTYAEAFDHHLGKQDMSAHASKARRERRRKDTTEKTSKTVRGAHRYATGGFGNVTLGAAVLGAGYLAARQAGVDQMVANSAKTTFNQARQNRSNTRAAQSFLRDMGL